MIFSEKNSALVFFLFALAFWANARVYLPSLDLEESRGLSSSISIKILNWRDIS